MKRYISLLFLLCLIVTAGFTQLPPSRQMLPDSPKNLDGAKLTPTPAPPTQATPPAVNLSDPMEDIVQAAGAAGYVSTTSGLLSHLDDHRMSAASLGNFFWQPTGYVAQDFAVRADVSWKSSSPIADWGVSGPGFVFRETNNNRFYAVFLNLDGRANLYRMDLSQKQGANLASKKCAKLDLPAGKAKIMLLVQGKSILFFVNDTLVLNVKEERLLRDTDANGRLNFALASGTNKDAGIQIEMTNVDLWQFGDPQILKTTPVASLSERQQRDLNTEKGVEAFQQGDFQAAIDSLNLAIQDNPAYANPVGFLYRGRAYYGLGQYGKAVSDLNESIAIDPQNAKSYLYRGYAYDKQKKSAQAINDYTKALSIDPQDVWAYRARAASLAFVKKYDPALADFDRAIELDAGHAPTLNNRCWVNYLLKQYEKGLPDCEAAVKDSPDDVNYLESRAAVYAALDKKDQAAVDLEKILSLTDDPKVQQRVKQALKKVSP